jgi:hypothetical protein
VLRWRWFPWLVFAATILSGGPLALVLYAVVPHPGDAVNCGGIGFGEVPCGWDAVGLIYIFFAIPFALGFATLLALSEVLGPRATFARSIGALVVMGLPWLGVVYLVLDRPIR